MCQDTRSGGLNDLLASAEIGHDALVDLSRKEAFEAPDDLAFGSAIGSGVARRPASHVRYDSGDAPSVAANAACDWPSAIRHARSVRGSTTSHHAIGAGRCEAGVGWPYFSQPICGDDRSLCSPTPSPLVPRQWAQSANSLGKWRARQDSNLRPSA